MNNENLNQDNDNIIIRYACNADIIIMLNCEKKHCDKCVHGEYHPIEVIKDV